MIGEEKIEKVLHGYATEEEAEQVAKWFATGEGQKYLSERIDDDFASMREGYEEIYVDHEIPSAEMFEKINKNIGRRKTGKIIFRIAAVLLPLALITGFLVQVNHQINLFGKVAVNEMYAPKSERRRLAFQDGTEIWLNSDSKLSYPQKFKLFSRKVALDGEAYFIVESNKARPFIVELDEATVEVQGTHFNVEAYAGSDKITITLDEGSVNVISSLKEEYELAPGEKLTLDKKTGEVTISAGEKNESAWLNNKIVFSNESLAEVIQILTRWYDVEFIIEDSMALIYSYNMAFENEGLEQILLDMERITPVKFIFEDQTIKIRMSE